MWKEYRLQLFSCQESRSRLGRAAGTGRQAVRLALAVVLLSTALAAQMLTGTMSGEVADPTGAKIAGVSVAAKNLDTNIVYRTKGNEAGVYVLPLLPTGKYELTVEAPGFRSFVRTGLALGAEQRLRIDTQLTLGSVSEAVTVSGEAPLLKTEDAALGTRFNATAFENLPVSRTVTNVLRTAPGVVPNPTGYGNGVADGDINGGRAGTSSILVDGVGTEFSNLNVNGGGSAQPGYLPILEAVDEVIIQTANYSAETGRGGASVQITTRPGTNKFHGGVFHFFENDKLNANSFFNNLTGNDRPQQRYNLFGGMLGGPVFIPKIYDGHNRTFFTFAYEGTRQISYANRISTVPSPAMRTGDFSGLATVFDPASFQPAGGGAFSAMAFPGNKIPSTRFAAQSTAMLPYYPAPNQPGSVANYSYLQSLPYTTDTINMRGDHTFSDKNRVSVRYGRISNVSGGPLVFPGPAGAGSDSLYKNATNLLQNLSASHTYVFTPAVLNDFRFGYYHVYETLAVPGQSEGWAQKVGFPQIQPDKFPGVSLTTYAAFGGGNIMNSYPARNFDIADAVTVIRGRHSFKIGGQYRTLVFLDGRGIGVSFAFDTQATYNPLTAATRASTGNSFASFVLGLPSNTTTTARQSDYFRFREKYFGAFVQDDFKVNSRLTLNLGLRWETTTPRTEDNDLQTVFNLRTLTVDVAGQNGYPRSLHDANYLNFGPRFGFAYAAAKNTVVRGGYGLFYLATDVTGNTFTSPGPGQSSNTYVANGAANLFPVTFANFASMVQLPTLGGPIVVNPNVAVSWMPHPFPNAHQQQWNLTIQRQLPRGVLAELGYVGNHASHLEFSRNLNQISLANLTAPGFATQQSRRPYPTVGNINTQRNDPMGDSNYHALQSRLQRRLAAGIGFDVAYTFSKVIDNSSDVAGFRQANIVTAPQDNYNLRAERSLATFNRTHSLTFNTIWEIPVGHGRRFLKGGGVSDAVLGGWTLSTITAAYSGLPLVMGVANANAITNTMGGSLRPNRLACAALPGSQRSIANWFDANAYAAPSPNTFGNTSRTETCVKAPGMVNVDLLLAKQFRITEALRLNMRGEFFNALNHFNPGQPNSTVGNAAIGRITSAQNGARVVQASLRLTF